MCSSIYVEVVIEVCGGWVSSCGWGSSVRSGVCQLCSLIYVVVVIEVCGGWVFSCGWGSFCSSSFFFPVAFNLIFVCLLEFLSLHNRSDCSSSSLFFVVDNTLSSTSLLFPQCLHS